jgi:hypothetical protein
VRRDERQLDGERRAEAHLEHVPAGAQPPGDVHRPAAEHVGRREDFFAVEQHGGIGVEPVEHQLVVRPREIVRADGERGAVLPVLPLDPLQPALVVAVERIGDDAVREEVGVHRAGDGGRQPERVARAPELPSVGDHPLDDRLLRAEPTSRGRQHREQPDPSATPRHHASLTARCARSGAPRC